LLVASCDDVKTPPPHHDAAALPSKPDTSTSTSGVIDASADFSDRPVSASQSAGLDAAPSDLDARAKHLLEAIAQDDASLAADIVLPRQAYMLARDAQDPAEAYESKLKGTFGSQISRAHRHEHGMERAVFVSFEVGTEARVAPKRHEWKEPVWHATRNMLTFTIDGRVQRIEIAEMIAWRGNWYVSRIHEGR
jgi:hypothetical protein